MRNREEIRQRLVVRPYSIIESVDPFIETLNVVLAESKRQFLNGAQRVVLTRDGDAIFCEPDEYDKDLDKEVIVTKREYLKMVQDAVDDALRVMGVSND